MIAVVGQTEKRRARGLEIDATLAHFGPSRTAGRVRWEAVGEPDQALDDQT